MRTILVKAAAVALLALAAGGCASTVPGTGSLDTAAGPGASTPASPDPTAAPSTDPASDPTGTPTDPTGTPTDPTGTPGGDSAGDQQAVADIAERWYHALGELDGDTVCGLMTPGAQRKTGTDCPKSVRDTDFTAAQRDAMRRIEVDPDKIVVSGDTARVPGSAFSVGGRVSGSSGRLQAARDGAGWLIDDVG